jgi:hypothetical protein
MVRGCPSTTTSTSSTTSSKIVLGYQDGHSKRSNRSRGKNLTAALARDLKISTKTLGGHTWRFPRDEEPGRTSSSLNSKRTNPQHYLIRPERIPSNECLSWNSLERGACRSIKSQHKAPNENFRWEQISKPISAKRPILRNENKDADTQVSAKTEG